MGFILDIRLTFNGLFEVLVRSALKKNGNLNKITPSVIGRRGNDKLLMSKVYPSNKHYHLLIPSIGIAIFVIIYIVATFCYPGGSQADRYAPGFSWANNYWCNLLNKLSINGQVNTAAPIALTGLAVFCISLIFFWNSVPLLFDRISFAKLIRICGISSALVSVLLVTSMHDPVIEIAGTLGLIAILLTLICLYKQQRLILFWMGIFCALLGLINFYMSIHPDMLLYLPIVQKGTFVIFLVWFCLMNIAVYKHSKKTDKIV